jgi:hypothetical protein
MLPRGYLALRAYRRRYRFGAHVMAGELIVALLLLAFVAWYMVRE